MKEIKFVFKASAPNLVKAPEPMPMPMPMPARECECVKLRKGIEDILEWSFSKPVNTALRKLLGENDPARELIKQLSQNKKTASAMLAKEWP